MVEFIGACREFVGIPGISRATGFTWNVLGYVGRIWIHEEIWVLDLSSAFWLLNHVQKL